MIFGSNRNNNATEIDLKSNQKRTEVAFKRKVVQTNIYLLLIELKSVK